MIADRIGRHEVLWLINQNYEKIWKKKLDIKTAVNLAKCEATAWCVNCPFNCPITLSDYTIKIRKNLPEMIMKKLSCLHLRWWYVYVFIQ